MPQSEVSRSSRSFFLHDITWWTWSPPKWLFRTMKSMIKYGPENWPTLNSSRKRWWNYPYWQDQSKCFTGLEWFAIWYYNVWIRKCQKYLSLGHLTRHWRLWRGMGRDMVPKKSSKRGSGWTTHVWKIPAPLNWYQFPYLCIVMQENAMKRTSKKWDNMEQTSTIESFEPNLSAERSSQLSLTSCFLKTIQHTHPKSPPGQWGEPPGSDRQTNKNTFPEEWNAKSQWRKLFQCDPKKSSSTNLRTRPIHQSSLRSWNEPCPQLEVSHMP